MVSPNQYQYRHIWETYDNTTLGLSKKLKLNKHAFGSSLKLAELKPRLKPMRLTSLSSNS